MKILKTEIDSGIANRLEQLRTFLIENNLTHQDSDDSEMLEHLSKYLGDSRKHISIFGYMPCYPGNLFDKLTRWLVKDIMCKCCIFIRGFTIGVLVTLLFNYL